LVVVEMQLMSNHEAHPKGSGSRHRVGVSSLLCVISVFAGIAVIGLKLTIIMKNIDEERILTGRRLPSIAAAAAVIGVLAGWAGLGRGRRVLPWFGIGLNVLAFLIWLFIVQL
jgi:hypothetical protein